MEMIKLRIDIDRKGDWKKIDEDLNNYTDYRLG